MKQIKAKIVKYGSDRRHVEIPQLYYNDFVVGEVVMLKKIKQTAEDK